MTGKMVSAGLARRWGAGTAAVVRLLIAADTPLSGVAIADLVGLTQPRVSQVLAQLTKLDAVRATELGYLGEPDVLLDLYLTRTRVKLDEPEFYFHHVDALYGQAQIVNVLARQHGIQAAVSADLALELLTPGNEPSAAVMYLTSQVSLRELDYEAVGSAAEATLILRVTNDDTVLIPAQPWRREFMGLSVTDPVQIWVDLLELGGEARKQDAMRLRQAILTKTLPRT